MESTNTTDASNDMPLYEIIEMLCSVLEHNISPDDTPADTQTGPSCEQPNEQSSEHASSPINCEGFYAFASVSDWDKNLVECAAQECNHVTGMSSDVPFLQQVAASPLATPVNSPREEDWLNYLVSPRNCKQQKCYHKQRKLQPYKKRQNKRNRKQNKTNCAKDETVDCPPKKPMTQKPKLPKDEGIQNASNA